MNTKSYRNRVKVWLDVVKTILNIQEYYTLKTAIYTVWWAIDTRNDIPLDQVLYIQYIVNTIEDLFTEDPYNPVSRALTSYSNFLIDNYL